MESKPMTTSEPTTGEIVRALRSMQTSAQVVLDSGFGTREGECDVVYRNRRDLAKNAADRLESQERNIETLRAFHERYAEQTSKKYVEEICALTARAEQAEKNRDIWEKKWWEEALKKVEAQWERDALISSIERLRTKKIVLCSICEFEDLIGCCHKNHCEGYQLFKRRGLPQEGEG
jgi:phosphopentomutase